MSELAPLIADLALILICAGVMALLFKKLGQPLVLGYIVAGFIASPHFALTPSVIDTASIHVWSDIGVIFLLFALGLEFSFKKIVKVGGPAIIAALTIIFGMIFLGITVGSSFGWKRMDAIFLGGMIAMSSTAIIYKAFDDLGLRKKQFTGLVLSILILEDILAVLLMVILSTIAVSNSFQGGELLMSIGKLLFFIILWFVVGLYLIPQLLRKTRSLMNDETLLVVALGLCFGMVVVAAKLGFSAAFGAFIMGSILAETIEAEHIDKLVRPVKDLFGAIFFVSVGMMVDPAMIVKYAGPILAINLTVLVGQVTFATIGVLLSGQNLKTAMQCGFSLTQIGEFAFIIAGLGVSLGVTSDFLYPIVVAVSVITIFLTPYMIRLAEPAYAFVEKHLPERLKGLLDRYATGSATPSVTAESQWKTYLVTIVKNCVIYGIVCIAIIGLAFRFGVPPLQQWLPGIWGSVVAAILLLLVLAPFLRSIVTKKTRSEEFKSLWQENRNRAPLVASVVIRVMLAMGFIFYIFFKLFHFSGILVFILALALVIFMVSNRFIKRQSFRIEQTFKHNLRAREIRAEYLGEKRPEYASSLLSKDLHLADFDIPEDIDWAGKSLAELNFGQRFGVHVVSILRGRKRINIPKAADRLYPQDRIQVIGTDSEMEIFGAEISKAAHPIDENLIQDSEMILRQLPIHANSPFLGKTLRDSGIRNKYHCLIAGVETEDGQLHTPDVHVPFNDGDTLWIVGERQDVAALLKL
ncbi:MAG: cation:proton antiporter [Bacteroidales bacterium]|nr:cation:proton antiporter [Bacteroidales bacterium]